MPARSSKPVSVTLGPLAPMARERVASGRFASMSEVVRAGLRALEREEEALDRLLKAKVEEALGDHSPAFSQEEVFADLRQLHRDRTGR